MTAGLRTAREVTAARQFEEVGVSKDMRKRDYEASCHCLRQDFWEREEEEGVALS